MSEESSSCGCGSKAGAPTASVPAPVSAGGPGTTLRVAGMDCPDEIAAIERVLKPIAGVGEIKVNLMAGTATIAHDQRVTPEQLIQAIGTAGLKASTMDGSEAGEEHSGDASRVHLILVIISGIFTGVSLLLQWQNLFAPYGKAVAAAVAILAGGWFIFPKAIRALRHASLDMNVLMSVAVIGAACIGEWTEAAAVVFLFALSELLEGFSVGRARRAIQSLLELTPETALVKRGDQIQEVRVEEVKVDETLIIKSGARVPLDGVVTSGESAINQAPITGESMPVEKNAGDTVFAGTINGEGSLEAKVTKTSTDTTLAKIIKLVGEAQGRRAPSQRFVDRFAKIYTPTVFVAAILILVSGPLLFNGSWLDWTYRALVLLVIACPCALVISTPVSIVSGLTAMARRGVLIKGGVFLEEIGKLKALAVDKTGTITEGKPRVQQVIPWNGKSEEEILRIAAAIDTHSEHPLAQAVVKYAKEKTVQFPRSENYQSKTGRGAEARIDGHLYFVGNHRFTHESAVCSDETERKLGELEAQAMSVVIVGHKPHEDCKGEVLGILAVADAVRPNAADAIKALHAAGVEKVVMLSGDNQRTVDAISKQVGIDEAKGDLLPDQKIERVRELLAKHKHVGMIGDGVNDAPAMAAASIGIAMGGAGTDTAIETADIALMQDDLSKVAEAIRLGRRTVGVIQANIIFALGVKAIFLALALTGHTSLWLAILADTGATIIVIGNATRLLRRPGQRVVT
ncbi:MAG: cadmium-translocating P-type ATPase [Verrucomicrobiales bacterium]|nr:cadmium-translocating P-type ATPase [Verrucomicrobiales bacterium]